MLIAGFFPGIIYHLAVWYHRDERTLRIVIFYLGALLANAIGGTIVSLKEKMDESREKASSVYRVTVLSKWMDWVVTTAGNGSTFYLAHQWFYLASSSSFSLVMVLAIVDVSEKARRKTTM